MMDLSKLSIERGAARTTEKPRRRHWLWLALAAGGVWFAADRAGWLVRERSVEVATVSVRYPAQAVTLFNATGYVVPQTKADIASKATGRLQAIEVVEGSRVEKDQVVARLESADVTAAMQRAAAEVVANEAAIAEARARLAAARAHVAEQDAEVHAAERAARRADELRRTKFVSVEAHDAALARRDRARAAQASAHADAVAEQAAIAAAQARLAAARAAHEEARVQVEYTLIRAPFAGVVLSKEADIGDVLAPFAATTESKGAVVTMADLDTLQVEADVSESNLTQIARGQACEIELDALPDVRLRGEVDMIVPTIDRTKATVLAKVRFVDSDPRVLPDMSARVAFLSRAVSDAERAPRHVVPLAAVVTRDGEYSVFKLDGERVTRMVLPAGEELGDARDIGHALAPGTRIVVRPPADLADGMRVRIAAPSN
jgi:RND family efflux transporter MFP subunit